MALVGLLPVATEALADDNQSMARYALFGYLATAPDEEVYLGSFGFDLSPSARYTQTFDLLSSGEQRVTYRFGDPTFFAYDIVAHGSSRIFISSVDNWPSNWMQIQQSLAPDGSSSLVVSGGGDAPCHGGCTYNESFSLAYASAGDSLFADLSVLRVGLFTRLSSAVGNSLDEYRDFVPPNESWISRTSFSITATSMISPVPEPGAWALMTTGLALVLQRRRRATLAARARG